MPRCTCAGNACNCLVQAGDNVVVSGRGTVQDPYIVSSTGGGGAATWGTIGGDLADQTDLQAELDLKAPLASPAFTGNPTAPTPATGDNDTSVATTAFVKAQGYAPLASPALTGNPTAPTQTAGNNSTRLATTAFVQAASGLLVPKSLVDAKGDLIVATGNDTPARLPVGSDGQFLTADSAESTGMKWVTPSGGGGGGVEFPYPPITEASSNWWAGPPKSSSSSGANDGEIRFRPVFFGRPFKLTTFQVGIGTGGAGALIHVGLYGTGADGTTPSGGALLHTLISGGDASSSGTISNAGLDVNIDPGFYWLGILVVGSGVTLVQATRDPLVDLIHPRRASDRVGGISGSSGLSALPSVGSGSGGWDFNTIIWYGMKTAVAS